MLKKWILYHGTGLEEAKEILKYGLKPHSLRPLFLATEKKISEEYSRKKIGYKFIGDESPRKGVVLKIILTEKDFDDQIKIGSDPRIVMMRKDNLEKAIKEKWLEYEWYYPIPPNRIKIM